MRFFSLKILRFAEGTMLATNHAICNICEVEVTFESGNLGALFTHFRMAHISDLENLKMAPTRNTALIDLSKLAIVNIWELPLSKLGGFRIAF